MSDLSAWADALRRAALPGAARIRFGRMTKAEDQSVAFSMNSYNGDGDVIGDDRDYELLKAVFTPLERLSEGMNGDFMLEMDLTSGVVSRATSD